ASLGLCEGEDRSPYSAPDLPGWPSRDPGARQPSDRSVKQAREPGRRGASRTLLPAIRPHWRVKRWHVPHDKIHPMRFPGLVLLSVLPCLAQTDVVLIHGARVVDGTGAPARMADVRLRGGRIEAVGTDIAAPGGARVVEAAGKTLIPGLFDLHTHLAASAVTGVPGDWGKNLKAYLAAGVTTVNDFATYGEMFEPMRRLLAGGNFPAPRV